MLGCQFIPAPDADGDGICDPTDNCPTVFGQVGSPCDDNSACTTGDTLDSNCTCVGTAITCDDGGPCTIDSCDPSLGCQFAPAPDADGDGLCDAIDNCPAVYGQVGSPCDDNSACTTGDTLDSNCTCVGTAITCDDGDPCTIDSCDPSLGCQFRSGTRCRRRRPLRCHRQLPRRHGQVGHLAMTTALAPPATLDSNCTCVGTAITRDDGASLHHRFLRSVARLPVRSGTRCRRRRPLRCHRQLPRRLWPGRFTLR
ncbi:MAG: hypothetical protein IPI07_17545 [Flavobacteriales bacterium]|nr:hypothetical protein [Flavobacteriales bacterium]